MPPEISVLGKPINITGVQDDDFVSLTDLAKAVFPNVKPAIVIENWLSTSKTLDFIGLFEELNNPIFKVVYLHDFKNRMTLGRMKVTPQNWIRSVHVLIAVEPFPKHRIEDRGDTRKNEADIILGPFE